jgi:hypothetical protein
MIRSRGSWWNLVEAGNLVLKTLELMNDAPAKPGRRALLGTRSVGVLKFLVLAKATHQKSSSFIQRPNTFFFHPHTQRPPPIWVSGTA